MGNSKTTALKLGVFQIKQTNNHEMNCRQEPTSLTVKSVSCRQSHPVTPLKTSQHQQPAASLICSAI